MSDKTKDDIVCVICPNCGEDCIDLKTGSTEIPLDSTVCKCSYCHSEVTIPQPIEEHIFTVGNNKL